MPVLQIHQYTLNCAFHRGIRIKCSVKITVHNCILNGFTSVTHIHTHHTQLFHSLYSANWDLPIWACVHACLPWVYGSTYRICLNRGPGLYFFPEIFDPASIQAQLLFEPGLYSDPASIWAPACIRAPASIWARLLYRQIRYIYVHLALFVCVYLICHVRPIYSSISTMQLCFSSSPVHWSQSLHMHYTLGQARCSRYMIRVIVCSCSTLVPVVEVLCFFATCLTMSVVWWFSQHSVVWGAVCVKIATTSIICT